MLTFKPETTECWGFRTCSDCTMQASLGCLMLLPLLNICKGDPSNRLEVKPWECPYQFRDLDGPPPYRHTCDADYECPGHQKCCLSYYHRECKNAVPGKGKPGICPGQQRDMYPSDEDLCKNDRDCPGDLKCCFFHGGMMCKDPVIAKTFGCPKKNAACIGQHWLFTCNDDTDCPGYERCCDSHCVLPCKDPEIEKPGSCPLPPSYPTCADFLTTPTNACTTDQQCLGHEKCCQYGCRLQCKMPLQDKPGFCPAFNRSSCLSSPPPLPECSSDSQCPGSKKCCCHGNCRMECTESVTEKPGTCPPRSAKCRLSQSGKRCVVDTDCPGRKKCCSLCGTKCINPLENAGFCPVDPEKEKQCGYLPPPLCNNDTDCKAHEKCCLFGCGVQCVKALPVKPGMCPPAVSNCKLPLAQPECHDDGDCPLNRKCCQLCGNKCLDTVPDHEGVCPSYISKSLVCPAIYAPSCDHDWNCTADEKCCTVGCQRKCVKALKEKMGECSKVTNVTNESIDTCNKCNNDKDCPGNERCCAGPKGRECQQPSNFVGLPIPEEDQSTKH